VNWNEKAGDASVPQQGVSCQGPVQIPTSTHISLLCQRADGTRQRGHGVQTVLEDVGSRGLCYAAAVAAVFHGLGGVEKRTDAVHADPRISPLDPCLTGCTDAVERRDGGDGAFMSSDNDQIFAQVVHGIGDVRGVGVARLPRDVEDLLRVLDDTVQVDGEIMGLGGAGTGKDKVRRTRRSSARRANSSSCRTTDHEPS